MENPRLYYDPIQSAKFLNEAYKRYLNSIFHIKNPKINRVFKKEIEDFEFSKGPFIEATPPFKKGKTFQELINEGILNPLFEKFIYDSFEFLRTQNLYKHQELSIRKVINNRNIVITSSTSSGKTESFLIPIYDELLKEYKNGTLNPGVRVLLLYPMNALVNDQLRKLRKISYFIEKNFKDLRITFGRYTGDTEEKKNDAINQFKELNKGQEPPESELLSREEMRNTPPHILITNYAMLEYLLLRPQDHVFFSEEFGNNWKFIVLDEAHVYNGTAGMEVGMLLRRLKQRVNKLSKKKITCIISSATLISDKSDYVKVIEFAKNLFGENFEWNDTNKDIVLGERESKQIIIKFALTETEYQDLHKLIFDFKIRGVDEGIKQWIHDKMNIAISDINYPMMILYNYLIFEQKILKIKDLLKDSALNFNDLASKFYNIEYQKLSSQNIDLVKKIVEIGVWLRDSKDDLPLIPARFHYFLKTPESVFISFFPKYEIYLERRIIKKYNDLNLPVFEMHVCKRCGQIYLFGKINENDKYEQIEKQSFLSEVKTIFLMLIEDTEIFDLEEDFSNDEEKICVKCGKILRRGDCDCQQPKYMKIKRIDTLGRHLTKCYACEYSSPSINRVLVLGRNTPSVVIATNLFQNAPLGEKLLTFADSRQQAAFFAPFLEFTYNMILFRNMILTQIKENTSPDFRLNGLTERLKKYCDKLIIFPDDMDDIEKTKQIWRHVILEFYNISSRNSLETLGLIKFEIIFPREWKPPVFLKKEPWNLSENEIRSLYQIILNTLRKNKAFSMPNDGPKYDDEIFERVGNKLKWFFKGKVASENKKRGIISFLPMRTVNSRINFLKKILKRININLQSSEKQKLSYECLGKIWDDIFNNWIASCEQDIFYKENSGYQLNYKYWNVSTQDLKGLHICENCGHITHLNVKNVCPTYRCSGHLIQDRDKIKEIQMNNHFSYMYQNFNHFKLRAKEHTAQLTTKKATETQIDFIRGKVQILSCSTTFELGVDLGELQIIFLTNIPPHPANYVQRSGRAGRRKDSAGFTVSLALLRSHDLNYFNNPYKMINGYIKPPIINIKNEKIILRHINSLIYSKFFKSNPMYFFGNDYKNSRGKVKWFLFNELFSKDSAYELIRTYIKDNFDKLEKEIEEILPKSVEHKKYLNKDLILNNLFEDADPNGIYGKFFLAMTNTVGETEELKILKAESLNKYGNAQGRERNRLHNFINWIERRINTIMNEPLINYLSRNSIIPKYGFPIDVVPLEILNINKNSKEISLDRDLRIAISEYAPGSSVVANGKIWKSAGLKALKDQTWPIFEYLYCPNCEQFNIRPHLSNQKEGILQGDFICINCKYLLNSEKKNLFIDPIFGFVTNRNDKPNSPGRGIPERQYFSRPFFYSLSPFIKAHLDTIVEESNISIALEYAPNGELVVLCKGKKEQGFIVCYDCGRSWNKKPKLKKGFHENPYGNRCNGLLHYRIHLGHKFKTDILKISFPNIIYNKLKIGYSLLYAILEGISDILQIDRRDIDGCLFNRNESINNSLILFDNVPGGAGHVMRIIENKDTLIDILKAAKNRMDSCNCGKETSCYNCLRNYQNQFCHDKLRRGEAKDCLEILLNEFSKNDGKTKFSIEKGKSINFKKKIKRKSSQFVKKVLQEKISDILNQIQDHLNRRNFKEVENLLQITLNKGLSHEINFYFKILQESVRGFNKYLNFELEIARQEYIKVIQRIDSNIDLTSNEEKQKFLKKIKEQYISKFISQLNKYLKEKKKNPKLESIHPLKLEIYKPKIIEVFEKDDFVSTVQLTIAFFERLIDRILFKNYNLDYNNINWDNLIDFKEKYKKIHSQQTKIPEREITLKKKLEFESAKSLLMVLNNDFRQFSEKKSKSFNIIRQARNKSYLEHGAIPIKKKTAELCLELIDDIKKYPKIYIFSIDLFTSQLNYFKEFIKFMNQLA